MTIRNIAEEHKVHRITSKQQHGGPTHLKPGVNKIQTLQAGMLGAICGVNLFAHSVS